jgi:hypothetical protein
LKEVRGVYNEVCGTARDRVGAATRSLPSATVPTGARLSQRHWNEAVAYRVVYDAEVFG